MNIGSITIGQFFPGDSPVHRVDPRVKILLTAAYIAAVFSVGGFIGYALMLAYVCAVAALSTISVKYLLKGLKPIMFIIAFTFILNVFITKGEKPIFSLWIISVYPEGLRTATYFALRLIFLVIGTSVLTLTTSPIALTDALERLLKPLKRVKFPVHELAMMMTIALRFIPVIMEETDKIIKAQTARGADFESGNIIRRAKAMIPILVPLFVSAFRRADELAMAMEARCYRGDVNRTRMKVLRLTPVDFYACAGMVALLAALFMEGRVF